jgi:hypothetical protein
MGTWVPRIRQAGKTLLPELPDEPTRELMADADRETFPLHLYNSVDCILGDALAPTIAELERYARQTEDPRTWKFWHDEDAAARVWRELDPEAPPPPERR